MHPCPERGFGPTLGDGCGSLWLAVTPLLLDFQNLNFENQQACIPVVVSENKTNVGVLSTFSFYESIVFSRMYLKISS